MQRLLVLGLNHKTAPLEVRERLAFSPEQRKIALLALSEKFDRCEAVLLSTCNRVELYVAREVHGHPQHTELAQFLAENRAVKLEDFQSSLYHKVERDAVSHLFSVAASLDSMVLGEGQILAQVRQAYEAAKEAGTAGAALHPLFQRAVAVGKLIRAQTTIGEGNASVASVALEYARRIFDVFTDKTVLSVGAGKMAERVLAAMAALKPGRLIVCNRDSAKAAALAEKFMGSAAGFGQLPDHLAAADIVITSTGSDKPIITRDLFDAVIRRRRYRPVFLIDIAVPRDIAADVGKIQNVYLYNLDDLQQAVTATLDKRSAEVQAAQRIVDQHVNEFAAWNRARMMGPLIDHLFQRSHALAQEELARALAKMPGVTDGDKQQLEELTRRIVNKLLHDPIRVLRDSDPENAPMTQYLHAVQKLFKLSDDGEKPDGEA